MTDWKKWDKIAAAVSDDEEDERIVKHRAVVEEATRKASAEPAAGVGNSLRADGSVAPSVRPGNARGNALSTNAQTAPERPIEKFSWADNAPRDGFVTVTVPLAPLGATASHQIRTTFSESAFSIEVKGAAGVTHYLRVSGIPEGGIDPEACRYAVESSGGQADVESRNDVKLVLRKRNPGARWPALGVVERPMKRPLATLTKHRWCDEKRRVIVWVDVPGVHRVPPERVRVRFRELSFDILIQDLDGMDHTFAVTELPMEIVVCECSHVIQEDCVKLYIRKWASTGWFKLQVHRGGGGD